MMKISLLTAEKIVLNKFSLRKSIALFDFPSLFCIQSINTVTVCTQKLGFQTKQNYEFSLGKIYFNIF